MKGLFQVRWWLGHGGISGGSVNCGLYASEHLAERVRDAIIRETRNHPLTALGIWSAATAVLRTMADQGHPVAGTLRRLMPKWVVRTAGGYAAKVRKIWGRGVQLPGPFATPSAAHVAMRSHLEHLAATRIANHN